MYFYYFFIGLFLIVVVFTDFFYTTLSGNGSGFLTKYANNLLSKIVLSLNWKRLRKISGFLHVAFTLNTWLIILLIGCFFIFSSDEQMIVNSTTYDPASFVNRFYYTCYILSTVGIGDYKPNTDFGQFITGVLSFSGFILLTTALAYVISITGAVSNKRNLAVAISSMGENPKALYAYFTREDKFQPLFAMMPDLRKLLHVFTHSYLSFPMIENYLTNKKTNSEGFQIVSLYEVIRIIFCQADRDEQIKMLPLINSLSYFVEIHVKNERANTNYRKEEVNALRKKYWTIILKDDNLNQLDITDIKLKNIRLKNIDSLLAGSGWSWEDIYNSEDEKSKLYLKN